MAMEAEAVENVEAAQVEQERGASSMSLNFLIEAVHMERAGLDKLEQGIDVLRDSLEERRHALDQQEQILSQFIAQLNENREAQKE